MCRGDISAQICFAVFKTVVKIRLICKRIARYGLKIS